MQFNTEIKINSIFNNEVKKMTFNEIECIDAKV